MESISSMFEGRDSSLFKTFEKATKPISERADVLGFFIENIKDKKGNKYRASFMGMKLSHLSLSDLYYFKSEVQDRINRGENYEKYFWGVLKPK